MTSKKTTEEDAATLPLTGTEIVRIVQAGVNKQVDVSNFRGTSSTPATYFVANFFGTSFAFDGTSFSGWTAVNTVVANTTDFSVSGTTVNIVTQGYYRVSIVCKFTNIGSSNAYQWLTGDIVYGVGVSYGDSGSYVGPAVQSTNMSSSSGMPYQFRLLSHTFVLTVPSGGLQLLPFVFARAASFTSNSCIVAVQVSAIRIG